LGLGSCADRSKKAIYHDEDAPGEGKETLGARKDPLSDDHRASVGAWGLLNNPGLLSEPASTTRSLSEHERAVMAEAWGPEDNKEAAEAAARLDAQAQQKALERRRVGLKSGSMSSLLHGF